MNLLFISSGLGLGGAEYALLRMLKHRPPHWRPTVVSLTSKGSVGATIEALGVPVCALEMRPGLAALGKLWGLARLIRSTRADLVQTWMYHADLLGGLAARMAGIKTVVWGIHHANLDADKNTRLTLMAVRACAHLSARLPAAVMFCSNAACRAHVAAGYLPPRIQVLPNGYELDHFRPQADAPAKLRVLLGVAEHVPLIGLVARVHAQKNHHGFFTMAGLVHRQRRDVHFVLVGAGAVSDNSELNGWMQEAGVPSVTHLLGERCDIATILAGLDVLVLTSWGEAFPNVLAEAMACGVPCVATDVGDAGEIIGDTGGIVPAGDMAGLAAAALELLMAPETIRSERSLRARQRIAERYDIKTVVRRFDSFYQSLI